jgi:hypothetical protein
MLTVIALDKRDILQVSLKLAVILAVKASWRNQYNKFSTNLFEGLN